MPTTADLVAKRERVIDRHRTLESVQGSGWHPSDPAMRQQREQGDPLCSLSEAVVAFVDDDRVRVVGPCVRRVWELCDAREFGGSTEAVERHADRVADRVAESESDTAELSFPSQEWNAILLVLTAARVRVVTTDAR